MEDNQLPPGRSVLPTVTSDSLEDAGANVPVSNYSVTQKNYPIETLEVRAEGQPGRGTVSPYAPTLRSVPFSRRRATVVSLAITILVVLITGFVSTFFIHKEQDPSTAQLNIPTQDVSFDGSLNPVPSELQGEEVALLVNGDIITKGDLKVSSGAFTSILRTDTLSANSVITLPNASGTICLNSNNCNYAPLDQFNAQTTILNQQVVTVAEVEAQLAQIVIPPQGVTTLNNQSGAVSIQGSTNQISVTTANGTITLSTPQSLDANANVQFGNLTLGASGTISANTLQQTGAGSDIGVNAGNDSITFTANGRTYVFPGSGAGAQTICTTIGNCGGGGGSVTDVNGETGSITLQGTANQVVVNTGAGTVTFSTPQNINTTSSPTFAALTLTGLGSGNVRVSGGVLTTGAINLAAEVTGTLGSGNGGTGLATTPTNGQLLIGNGAGYSLATLTQGAGITVSNGAGSITVASTLGTAIDTTEITDGTILEVDLSVTNAPTDNFILSYDQASGGFTWVDPATAGGLKVDSLNILTGDLIVQGTAGQIAVTDNATDTITLALDPSVSLLGQTIGNSEIENNAVQLGTQTTGNYQAGTVAGNGISVGGAAGEGWSPTLAVLYGATANTAVQGNTSITVSPGTNLTGGGSITLGAGGSVTLNVSASPTFAGDVVIQGGDLTLGVAAQAGSLILHDGDGETITVALPDVSTSYALTLPTAVGGTNQCLKAQNGTGTLFWDNCAGGAGGGLSGSGTLNRLAKFTPDGTTIGDSSLSDNGSLVTVNGNVNLAVQGTTITVGVGSTRTGSIVLNNSTNNNTVTVQSGGTGTSYALTLPTAVGATDQCLKAQDGTGTLFWDNCLGGGGGGGITSVDGQTGPSVAINNATGAGNVITIDNAAADGTTKGIAAFNATNFTAGGGVVNTAQGISTSAAPQFAGLTLTGNLGLGTNSLQGTTASIAFTNFDVASNGNTTVGGTLVATGLTTLNGGLTVEAGDTFTFNGDAFTDLTGNGLQVSTGVLTLALQANKGLEVDGSGLSLIDCALDQILKYNGSNQWICAADAGGSGVGDDVSVNGVAATNANLLNTAATGTAAATTWSLDTGATPDDITLTIGNASATDAGAVTTGTQTFAGAKTFNGQIVAGAGINFGGQTLQGTTAVIDFTNFDVTSGGTVTAAGDVVVQGGDLTVGTASLAGNILLHDGDGETITVALPDVSANYTLTLPTAVGATDQCLKAQNGTGTLFWDNCLGGTGGGGITSVDGQTGPSVAINNATGAANVITIDNAAADGTTKGIAAFNATNFSAAAGVVNTIQGISAAASPQFVGLTLTGDLQVDGNSILGSAASDTLAVNATTTFTTDVDVVLADSENLSIGSTITGTTSVSVLNMVTTNNTSSGVQNLALLQNAAGSGTTDGLLVLDNADTDTAVAGGIVVTSAAGGITTAIDVSDADIVNALLFGANDVIGSNFTIAGATGAVTSGAAAQQGSLALHDGNGQTATISVGSALAADTALAIPTTVGVSDTFCLLTLANCPGTGDAVTVNSVAATNANFLNTAASGTEAAVSWSLNTVSNPDDITISIGNASATVAGTVTTGSQTFAGAKTFNGQIVAGAGVNLGTQTLQGTTAVIDFSNFDVASTGSVTIGSQQTITLVGGTTAQRPGTTAEGMVYFDSTTDRLLTYMNGKWQGDRATATKIVAASNSSQTDKDAADYVADGTGDQTEINAALIAGAGGFVYLMPGTYVASASISVPNNTTLSGAGRGTLVELANVAGATVQLITNTDQGGSGTGVIVRDMRLDGRKDINATGDQLGVYFINMGDGAGSSAVPGGKITGLSIEDFRAEGIFLHESENNTISNNIVRNNGQTGGANPTTPSGIVLHRVSQNNTVTGNLIQGNTGNGLSLLWDALNNTITGNTAQGNGEDGFNLNDNSSNNTVTGNTMQGNGSDGIEIKHNDPSVGNTLTGNTMQGNTGYGVNLSQLGNNASTVITGNSASGNTAGGINIFQSYDNTVSGNKLHDNGGATANNGIRTEDGDNNTITSNGITDTSCTTTCFAINISDAASTSNYLGGNTIDTGTIQDLGTTTTFGGQLDNNGDFKVSGSDVNLFVEDSLTLGRQTVQMTTGGAATESKTITASYAEITGQDNAADIVTLSTSGVNEGDVLILTNISATIVNVDQTATTKLSGGVDAQLDQYDVMMFVFDGTNWLQVSASLTNS